MKKNKLFVTVFAITHWVKPVWPAKQILLTATLLMGVLLGDPGQHCYTVRSVSLRTSCFLANFYVFFGYK